MDITLRRTVVRDTLTERRNSKMRVPTGIDGPRGFRERLPQIDASEEPPGHCGPML